MGYKRMQNLTHDMENVFSEVRNGNIKVTPEMIDVLFQCLDALDEYKNNIQETSDEGTNDNENLIKALNDILNANKTGQAGKDAGRLPGRVRAGGAGTDARAARKGRKSNSTRSGEHRNRCGKMEWHCV